jgi:hypothetical protein
MVNFGIKQGEAAQFCQQREAAMKPRPAHMEVDYERTTIWLNRNDKEPIASFASDPFPETVDEAVARIEKEYNITVTNYMGRKVLS